MAKLWSPATGTWNWANVEQRCSSCNFLSKVSVFRTQRCCFGKLQPWLHFKTEQRNITIAITKTNTHQIQYLFLVACVPVKFLTWTQLSIYSSGGASRSSTRKVFKRAHGNVDIMLMVLNIQHPVQIWK